jgi:hypothetical protein
MNRGGKIVSSTTVMRSNPVDRMALYDSLDPKIREILREAPFQFSVVPGWRKKKFSNSELHSMRKRLREIQIKSTRATYGANHPQSY